MDGKKYCIDCNIFVTISEICKIFGVENKYVYSLFNDCYYDVSKLIYDTDIRTGDVIFL